jgi:alanine racemase
MSYISRKTRAIINLTALNDNYKVIDNLAKDSATIAILKADAYGHGATEIAKSIDHLVPAFAVAFIDEAIILRDAGIKSPILILEGPLIEDDFALALAKNFWLMLHNQDQFSWLMNQEAPYLARLWLKVDTGMNRLGYTPEQVSEIFPKILSKLLPAQQKELVICSHFSNAEETSNPKTTKQIKRFNQLIEQYKCLTSLANSAGIIHWPQSHGDFNRLGLGLYGINPIEPKNRHVGQETKLTPVMTLQSVVIGLRKLIKGDGVGYGETWKATKPSVIATVAIGYADGYPRNAKTGTPVFINGKLAPLVGRVSMDMITVDVTELAEVNLGDFVELWGENLPVEVIADKTDTISYELLTRVSTRLPRLYK